MNEPEVPYEVLLERIDGAAKAISRFAQTYMDVPRDDTSPDERRKLTRDRAAARSSPGAPPVSDSRERLASAPAALIPVEVVKDPPAPASRGDT